MRNVFLKLLLVNMFFIHSLFCKNGNYREDDLVSNALSATKALYSTCKNPGISKNKFLKAAIYIEKHLAQIKNSSKKYFVKKLGGVKYRLEYDSITEKIFIVLKNPKAFLGKGAKKTVYKSILYSQYPTVVARSEQSFPFPHERKAHKALDGLRGIIKVHAITEHSAGNKKYRTLYADLYQGTLKNAYSKHSLRFRQKLAIMKDLVTGLYSMHSHHFVHRDLHPYNYLVRTEYGAHGKKRIRAVIADLGRSMPISHLASSTSQMPRELRAPEGIDPQRLKGADYFATDVYALGCVFYEMYYSKEPSWQGNYLHSQTITADKKKRTLIRKLTKEIGTKRIHLMGKQKKAGRLSTKEMTELLIFQMLHENPEERISAAKLLQEIEKIF